MAGIVSVAQFCPEPLSACAQSVLATAGPRNANGFATSKESLYVRKAGRLLLLAGLGLGAGVGAICASILAYQPEMFTKNVTVMTEVGSVAPIVFFSILTYCCVCVTDGLVFATGRIEFAALAWLSTCLSRRTRCGFECQSKSSGYSVFGSSSSDSSFCSLGEHFHFSPRLGTASVEKDCQSSLAMSMEEEDFNDVESQKQN